MKAWLEFDLPDDDYLYMCAREGEGLRSAVWNLDQDLRRVVKHGDDEVAADYAQRWRTRLYRLLEAEGIDIHAEY